MKGLTMIVTWSIRSSDHRYPPPVSSAVLLFLFNSRVLLVVVVLALVAANVVQLAILAPHTEPIELLQLGLRWNKKHQRVAEEARSNGGQAAAIRWVLCEVPEWRAVQRLRLPVQEQQQGRRRPGASVDNPRWAPT
eukprot:scaffold691_cov181-Ochromonas_danica.AAC.9